jgi:predicted transcriptional regulator
MMKNYIIKDKIGHMIVDIVRNNPGIRLKDLCKKINMPYSTCRYRVLVFESGGLLRTENGNGIVKVYLKEETDNERSH